MSEKNKYDNYYFSKYLCFLEKKGLIVLFHQLHPKLIYIKKDTWLKLNKIPLVRIDLSQNNYVSLVNKLIHLKLLINNPQDDNNELVGARKWAGNLFNEPKILYLMFAQGCNFKCDFCPIHKLVKKYGNNLLSYEDAIAGIDLWRKNIKKSKWNKNEYYIIFYGGEPLLNINLLEKILPFIKNEYSKNKLPSNLKLMLCTNGSLITEKIAKLLSKYNVIVQIGIDKPIEDKVDSCSLNILHIINILKKYNIKIAASVTITPNNIPFLKGNPNYLKNIGILNYGYNLMKGEGLVKALSGKNIKIYYQSAANIILSQYKDKLNNVDYQFIKRLLSLNDGLPFSVDCTCYGSQIVIQADGQVTNCPFLRIDQGHIKSLPNNFKLSKTNTVLDWRKRIAIFNNKLLINNSNTILNGGGCAWNSYELYKDINALDIGNKIFSDKIVTGIIWKLLKYEKEIINGKLLYWCYRRNRHLQAFFS